MTHDEASYQAIKAADAVLDTFIQPKITGYRQLIAAETHLINEAKALGAAAEDLVIRLREYHKHQQDAVKPRFDQDITEAQAAERDRLKNAEPERWLAMGRTDIQTGVMKIVRSIAQPAS